MRFLRQVFLKGLIAIVPVALTIYLILALARGFESLLGNLLESILPAGIYFPGLGVLAGIGLVFAVGLMLETWATRSLWNLGERVLDRMPVVRAVFGAFKHIVAYLSSNKESVGGSAVLVTLHGGATQMVGLLTRENVDFFEDPDGEDLVAVLLPWSFQVGGITVFVPRSAVKRIPLTAQEALRLVLTGAVSQPAGGQASAI